MFIRNAKQFKEQREESEMPKAHGPLTDMTRDETTTDSPAKTEKKKRKPDKSLCFVTMTRALSPEESEREIRELKEALARIENM
jgi:hypothetical protein